MGIVEWVWDVTVWLAHGFGSMDYIPIGGYIAAGFWLLAWLVVALVVLSLLVRLVVALTRGVRTGVAEVRSGARDDESRPA